MATQLDRGRDFGQLIRLARKSHALTQRELAGRVGVDVSYVSKMETGRLDHTPSPQTIGTLAAVLQLDDIHLLEVAGKLPRGFDFAQSEAARTFLHVARRRVVNDDDWVRLTHIVEAEFESDKKEKTR
jgi:transcriptional regulator with XRE-family HTH domain